MRIGIDARCLLDENLTGVSRATLEISRALANTHPNWEFFLFVSGSKRVQSRLPQDWPINVNICSVRYPNKLVSLGFWLKWWSLDALIDQPIDCWLVPKFSFFNTNSPYLLIVHDLAFEFLPETITIWKHFYHRLLNIKKQTGGASKVLVPTARVAADLELLWKIAPDKIEVVSLGGGSRGQVGNVELCPVESSGPVRIKDELSIRPYFLSLATIEPRKNFACLLAAYARYKAMVPTGPRLVIAGAIGWKNRGIKQLLEEHPNRKEIELLGFVKEENKMNLYRHAVAFIWPSLYEGFGLPPLEALTEQTRVISGSFGGGLEVLGQLMTTPSNPGIILFNPYSVSDLTEAMIKITDLSKMMPNELELLIARTFSWENTARKVGELVGTVSLPHHAQTNRGGVKDPLRPREMRGGGPEN